MKTFEKCIDVYREQLKEGSIQVAYKGLIEYIMSLRTYFCKNYPKFQIPSNIYFGYMDMTYFSILTESLRQKKLKIAFVFNYDTFGFEVWLSGVNKKVLAKYWELIDEKKWDKYKIVKPGKCIDLVLEHVLDGNPDFSNLDVLTKRLEKETIRFIDDVEEFLLKYDK